MSTGYGWEGLRQVCATLLGACHVPECPCGGLVYLRHYNKCSPLPFYLLLKREHTGYAVEGRVTLYFLAIIDNNYGRVNIYNKSNKTR